MIKWQRFVLLLSMLLFMAGCGAANSEAASPVPTVLEVTRSSTTIPENRLPPFPHTITNAGMVQKLYAAAQILPKAGVHNWMCTIYSTVVYHVRFLQGRTVLQQWDMDAIGCYAIELHKGDLRQPNQAFVALFARTLGVARLY